jgi:hypothetical protein
MPEWKGRGEIREGLNDGEDCVKPRVDINKMRIKQDYARTNERQDNTVKMKVDIE